VQCISKLGGTVLASSSAEARKAAQAAVVQIVSICT
jgi:hypothetical protein